MRYKDRDELVEGLRAFADFLEEEGLDLPITNHRLRFTQHLYNDYDGGSTAKSKARRAALALGKVEKDWGTYYLNLRRDFGPVSLEFSIAKEQICERKVTGFKDVPEFVSPAHREELVEWTCRDSILAS
jgi:hypothetical protein